MADAFDAITTDRPYQRARTFDEGLAILKGVAGAKWDPECVAAFERILPRIPARGDGGRSPRGRLLCLWDDHLPEIALEPGPPGGAKMRWLKPGVDFSTYKRVMVDRVVFFLRGGLRIQGNGPAGAEGTCQTSSGGRWSMRVKKRYPVVTTPGPDVLRIRVAITDLRQNRPVLSDITSDGPIGLGKGEAEEAGTASWSGSGATCAEMVVFDSMANEVIGAAQDEQATGLKEKFTKWGSVEDAFQFWADRIRTVLDQAHGLTDC